MAKKKKRPGRPPKTSEGFVEVKLTIPLALYEPIRAEAERVALPVSSWIRMAAIEAAANAVEQGGGK